MAHGNAAVFIPVRLGSHRLAQKALLPIAGQPALVHLLERLKLSTRIHRIVVCTTLENQDCALVEVAKSNGVECFQGDSEDLLIRFRDAARKFDVQRIVNVDGDDLLVDPEQVDEVSDRLAQEDVDYVRCEGLPFGAAPFGFQQRALERVCETKNTLNTATGWGRFFTEMPSFKAGTLSHWPDELLHPEIRLTLDYAEDLLFFTRIFERLYKPGRPVRLRDAIQLIKANPEIRGLNCGLEERYWAHFAKESAKSRNDISLPRGER